MTSSKTWWGALSLVLAGLAGCGSDSDGGSAPPPPNTALAATIAAAAAVPANDSSLNPTAPFTVLQDASLPAVTVASPPKINFVVFSDGAVKTGLTLADMSFAIAKLVPGTNGNPDEWQNYVSRMATATAAGSPGAAATPPAQAMQATTDPKRSDAELEAAGLGAQLSFHDEGYYSYTFSADITDPGWKATINKADYSTNGVSFDPNATHRVAIQLSYKNAAGEVIRVNPRFDFKFVQNAAGGYDSVLLSDIDTQDFRMTDVSSCNTCHEKLALHGGGRVDTQYCVMCHNPGTTDPDSGNVLTMSTMTHKIHAGRGLASAAGGETYVIWGYNNVKYDYSEIGYPQALQNCAKCHTAQNPNTPQGDNWKSVPSQQACLTCHASNAGSIWDDGHLLYAQRFHGPAASAADLTNADCARCHAEGTDFGSDVVHWNQIEVNSALYKMNIESVAFNDTGDHKGRIGDGQVLPVQPEQRRRCLRPGDGGLHGRTDLQQPDEVRQSALLPGLSEHGRPVDHGHRIQLVQQRRQQRECLCLQGRQRRQQPLHVEHPAAGRHRDRGGVRHRTGGERRPGQGAHAQADLGGEPAGRRRYRRR